MIPFREYFDSIFASKAKWYKKYVVFLLCFVFVFVHCISIMLNDDLKPKNGSVIGVAGLYFFIATGIFIFMMSGDKLKQIKRYRVRIPLVILRGGLFIAWLFGSLIWIMVLFDF